MVDDSEYGIHRKVVREAAERFVHEGMSDPEMEVEKKYLLAWPTMESSRDVFSMTGFQCTSALAPEGNIKDRYQQSINAQAEAGAWLRDEPADVAAEYGFYRSPSSLSSRASKDLDGSEGEIEMQGLRSVSTSELAEEVVSQEQTLSIPACLYAQLRATKIKESVIRDAICRHGGGQKGLRGVVKAIMCWLMAKNRHSAQLGASHPMLSPSDSLSPPAVEEDQFEWYGNEAALGNAAEFQHGTSGDFGYDLPADLNCVMQPLREESGNLSGLLLGHGNRGDFSSEAPSTNGSPQVMLGESERSGWVGGLRSQQSCFNQVDMSAGSWVAPLGAYLPHDTANRSGMIRKRSPSPRFHDMAAYDDSLSQSNKIRRHSPAPARFAFSQNSMEASVCGGVPSQGDGSGNLCTSGHLESNPFGIGGLFSFCPLSPSPGDSAPQDLASFDLQVPILIDENLACGGAATNGCSLLNRSGSLGYTVPADTSAARKKAGRKFGAHAQSKDSPAACTRLARKNKMDRSRKAASSQANRSGAESAALQGGKGKEMWSSSNRTSARSQVLPAAQGPACKVKDRKDKEHLQFLLQKVLRPSDVGNLGRVVLPKKDAESHLPWLGAKEKFQFACEDYDTGDKMMLRYRFWPNNDSRMYVLENTGEFVRRHKLQESDKMLIYKDRQQDTYVLLHLAVLSQVSFKMELWIIRARKARDCVEVVGPEVQSKPVAEEKRKDPHSPGRTSSSGTVFSDRDGGTPESTSASKLAGSEASAGTVLPVGIATSQNDLLDFTDLPVVPMGEGTESLVRFPSLESFDVESLDMGPIAAGKQDLRSCSIVGDET